MKEAALQMMDLFLARVQRRYDRNGTDRRALEKMRAMHALVAAYPEIPAGTPDFHVSMQFLQSESDQGGSSWKLRGVQLRNGELRLTTGWGNSDGLCGSDQMEKPTDDIEAFLSALESDPARMGGPYL